MHCLVSNSSQNKVVQEDRRLLANTVPGCPNCTVFCMAHRNYGVCVVLQIKCGKLQTSEQEHCPRAPKTAQKGQNALVAGLKFICQWCFTTRVLAGVRKEAGDICALHASARSHLFSGLITHISIQDTVEHNFLFRCKGNNPNCWVAISTKQPSCLEGSSSTSQGLTKCPLKQVQLFPLISLSFGSISANRSAA